MVRIVAALILLTLVSCSRFEPPVEAARREWEATLSLVAIERSREEFELTLRNGLPGSIEYNLCPAVLERLENDIWIDVHSPDVCTMEIRSLLPNQSATAVRRVPPELPAGTYRFSTWIELPADRTRFEIATKAFAID